MPTPHSADPEFAQVEEKLLARWPENQVAPDLGRISALANLLGDPHTSAPVIHIAGTNGKTSTARIIEALLRAFGLSTGLYTSPAVMSMTDRVQINGEPIDEHRFAESYADVAPYLAMVDQQAEDAGGPAVTMFEAVTALGFATFADMPVDVMIIECGMGGTWDATNIVAPAVSVITPIDLDHVDYLGETIELIAAEKAGILARGAPVALAGQRPEAAAVLSAACAQLDIEPVREGVEFGVTQRLVAVGGQQLTISGLGGAYEDLYLPLHGEHQARNAALALATVELFLGASDTGESPRKLNEDTVRAGLASVTSPARLERVRTSPTVVIDSAHNPHGATAVATALSESFDMRPTIAVVAVVEGKDAYGLLSALEPAVDTVVVTRNSSPRSMTVDDLAEFARAVFGDERVLTSPDIAHATETAIELADQPEHVGSAGVVALGSVVTAADVRRLLRPAETVAPGVTIVAPSAENVELDEDGFEIDSFPQGPRIGDRP